MTQEQTRQLYELVKLIDSECPQGIIPAAWEVKCKATDEKSCISCWLESLEKELDIE